MSEDPYGRILLGRFTAFAQRPEPAPKAPMTQRDTATRDAIESDTAPAPEPPAAFGRRKEDREARKKIERATNQTDAQVKSRPRLQRKKLINFKTTDETADLLTALAEKHGTTKTAIIEAGIYLISKNGRLDP